MGFDERRGRGYTVVVFGRGSSNLDEEVDVERVLRWCGLEVW